MSVIRNVLFLFPTNVRSQGITSDMFEQTISKLLKNKMKIFVEIRGDKDVDGNRKSLDILVSSHKHLYVLFDD